MHTIPGAFQQLQQLYAEGEAALEAGDLAGAVSKFSEGIAIDDHFRQRYITMYAQRAFAYHQLGEIDAAIADYTKAIEMEPPINQAQYYFHRGMCHAGRDGGRARAIEDYTVSIALHDEHPGPFHLRGKLYIAEERWAEAEADLDRLIELAANPEGHALRAVARHMQGRDARDDVAAANELADDPGYAAQFHPDFA